MLLNEEGPGARAGALRADVIKLAGHNDVDNSMPTATDLQVRSVMKRYVVALAVAMVIAEPPSLRGGSHEPRP